MMIHCSDIKGFIEEIAPVHLAEDWDNVGLILGSTHQTVKKVMVCLDVTFSVAEEAIRESVDLIVSHHPVLFKGIKKINEEDTRGKLISLLLRNGISVYSAHTNLDVAEGGVNDQFAAALELQNIKGLNEYREDKTYFLGRVGELSRPMQFKEFIESIKKQLKIDRVRVIGHKEGEIRKVAVFCGSFDEDYSGFTKAHADILVTSDIKYHSAVDMLEMGMCVVDAGHFNTERVVVPALTARLKAAFPGIEVLESKMERDPFEFT